MLLNGLDHIDLNSLEVAPPKRRKPKRVKWQSWELVRRISDEIDQEITAREHGVEGPLHNWSNGLWAKTGTGNGIQWARYDNSKIRWR